MSVAKRILIVDDNYETVDYLQNALRLLDSPIESIGVPSGEEAWLEILRQKVDLLLVDLRLPGMSGSDLMKRAQKRLPDLPVIVMSGYAMEMMKQETAGLTVYRFLEKPMDTDRLIKMVGEALNLENRPPPPPPPTVSLPDEVRRTLERLRVDTGARQLLLATLDGELVYQNGGEAALQDAALLQKIGVSLKGGLAVTDHLAAADARTIQYMATHEHELYFANIGRTTYVALAFGAQNQRARIGTIWVFLQRAIRDLHEQLPQSTVRETDPPAVHVVGDTSAASPALAAAGLPPVEPIAHPVDDPLPEVTPIEEDIPMGDPMTLEEALAQGLIPNAFAGAETEAAEADPAVTLDLFSDLAAADEGELALLLNLAAADEKGEADSAEPELDLFGDLTPADDDDLALLLDLAAAGEGEAALEKEDDAPRGVSLLDDDDGDAELDLGLLDFDEEAVIDDAELDAFWDAATNDQAA